MLTLPHAERIADCPFNGPVMQAAFFEFLDAVESRLQSVTGLDLADVDAASDINVTDLLTHCWRIGRSVPHAVIALRGCLPGADLDALAAAVR